MAFNKVAREMLEMLPVWMKLRQDDSVGGGLVDTLGSQLVQIEDLISNILLSGFVQTNDAEDDLNIFNIDYLYKVRVGVSTLNTSVNINAVGVKDGITYDLSRSYTIYDFYSPGLKFYLDTDTYIVYVKDKYDSIVFNDIEFTDVETHHVWGPLDEIGLLFACPRIPLERNSAYKIRLMDVFKNPGNSSRIGLKNYISRSLGITADDVVIESLDNDDFISSMINQDGTVKDELREYIEISRKVNDLGIGMYWEVLDEKRDGLRYLPIIWDLGLGAWDVSQIQNGIGDTDDLEIIAPEQETAAQDFTYALYAEGLNYPDRKVYPEHEFKYKVYAKGTAYDNGYRPETYKYTVTASELVPLDFDVVAHKIYEHQYDVNWSGTVVDYSAVTESDRKPDAYIKSNVKITNGAYVSNTNKRFIQLSANLTSSDSLVTPKVTTITLAYTKGGVAKTLKIQGSDGITLESGVPVIGFQTNTWDTVAYPSPIMRVKCDTNDMSGTEMDGSDLALGHGLYEKIYDSSGDWDDGIANQGTINVKVGSTGTLKLSI